jgi:D-glycero-alpha-D-manno-heptose-7-phosphate kinase
MYLSKTPLRISFLGGGSDMESFYHKQDGMVISTSIDKYIYLTMHALFEKGQNFLKYSKSEKTEDINYIEHPIIREVLKGYHISNIDFNSSADIPGGTGLGSSSAFTAGLINLCLKFNGQSKSNYWIAEEACDIEINRLKEPIGKQDQYACAIGGFNQLTFSKNGKVIVEPIRIKPADYQMLNDNLYMYYTGIKRSASAILHEQKKEISKDDKFQVMKQMVEMVPKGKTLLENGELDEFGRLLHAGWELKKQMTGSISNQTIEKMYELGINSGALGGKLLGAGGGGFLLFYVPSENKLNFMEVMNNNLRHVPFRFEQKGTTCIKL